MRLPISCAVLGIMMISMPAFAQPAKLDPAGTWLTEDGRAKIRIEKCGEDNAKLCGFVAWMKDPTNEKGQPRTDIKNPDPAKRNRPSLGLELMEELKAEDSTHFSGEIYNAEDGKKYAVTLGIEKPAELEVRGCLLHFLCGSQTWTRVADLALPPANKVVSNTPKALAKTLPTGQRPHDQANGK